ncbi:putative ABC transporter ATP-binding protein YejF [compost metagenome]|jgi:microcin C transport system ATP-binding protein|uniref:Dipeptide transport system ATP-binding protein DppD n=1 Tax=Cupriavidus necator (strain ATCC 43291 / DSM 13513 / CCUG 52238 / LMG 8453 / N-1) TaxID=1042878 RepID=G0F0L8_CUPNN|nr:MULTISPECIES: ABC transporter ATP-binding protein [Cupriavidus]AEI77647.1 dipeptide transport system ATP-binding protein DppD [Cupriavidus necator N-1]MDX6013818.1 ABC transporter ATP-binding protein [Cupriavidus necator]QUN27119.1 ABC transporter ATP-binding protein [Cupriavidus sp. KK10]
MTAVSPVIQPAVAPAAAPAPGSTLMCVDKLSVTFGHGEHATRAVREVSFDLRAGERYALVGESGSGKTVTALAMLRLVEDAYYDGAIRFEGKDLLAVSDREMRGIRGAEIAMIFQEPMTALNPLYTIGNQIVETLALHEGLDRRAARERAIALLERTGISDAAHRFDSFPHQLSGGQRQRAMIAMALACRPKLLLADEPTTALDVTIRAQIMDLLRDLQAEFGMAVMLITHDLNLVRSFAQRVGVMEKGVLVETGETAQVFAAPQHPYTRKLIDSRPRREVLPLVPLAPVLLEARKLSVNYARKRRGLAGWFGKDQFAAVKDVDFQLREGETVGIVGESGSGKTTLAHTVLALQRKSGGTIHFLGRSFDTATRDDRRQLRARMQVVFQDPFGSLAPRMTIEQIVGEGLALHQPGLSREGTRQRVIEALREVGLDRTALGRYPHEFSGGQRQRIAIARVLILKPQILVLDEPTSALDVSIQQQVLALLSQLQHKYNLTYLFISHDLAVIRAMAHRVFVMKAGEVVEAGDTEAVLGAPQHPYTRKLMAAAQVGAA